MVVLAACGGGGASSSSKAAAERAKALAEAAAAIEAIDRREERAKAATVRRRREGKLKMSKAEITNLSKIEIKARSGPPPKKLVVRNLREGDGAPLRSRDAILVRYFSVTYGEARDRDRTGRIGPTKFGLNEVVRGWKVGLPGMRVGGRRELIAPPRFAYKGKIIIYVIDLLAVYPNAVVDF